MIKNYVDMHRGPGMVAQWVERLATNPTTPAGLWFDPQLVRIFF